MRVLTNDYRDFELLNLGYQPDGRGPYVVRQEGIPPNSVTTEEDRFLLRKDGVWILNLAVFALPEKAQTEFLFQDVGEVFATVEKLVGIPTVEDQLPADKTPAELLEAMRTSQDRLWKCVRGSGAGELLHRR